MARKVTAETADQAAKTLNEHYNEAAEPASEDSHQTSISSNLHYLLTSTLGNILMEYYNVDDIGLGFTYDQDDDLGQIYVAFRDDISYTGAEKLRILGGLSEFLKDLDAITKPEDNFEVNAHTSECIFEITYQPLYLGKFLCQILVNHDPSNVPIGNNLSDASRLIERAEIPACKLH